MKLKLVVVDLELSKRAKRITAAVLAPLIVLGGGAIAYASVPHTWSDGDTLTAADLNGNFTALDQRIGVIEATAPTVNSALGARLAAGTTQPMGYALGSNSIVTDTPTNGVVNPSTTQTLWQGATTVSGTDGNGFMTITYPTPFPHGVVTVVAQSGESNFTGYVATAGEVIGNPSMSTSTFQVKIFNKDGTAYVSGPMRINWIAIGY